MYSTILKPSAASAVLVALYISLLVASVPSVPNAETQTTFGSFYIMPVIVSNSHLRVRVPRCPTTNEVWIISASLNRFGCISGVLFLCASISSVVSPLLLVVHFHLQCNCSSVSQHRTHPSLPLRLVRHPVARLEFLHSVG